MTFEMIFTKAKDIVSNADVSSIQEDFIFQFHITGAGAGFFYVEKNGEILSVRPCANRRWDALITCSTETLEKLMKGKLDPVVAFALRKIKVEGNLKKLLMLKQLLK